MPAGALFPFFGKMTTTCRQGVETPFQLLEFNNNGCTLIIKDITSCVYYKTIFFVI